MGNRFGRSFLLLSLSTHSHIETNFYDALSHKTYTHQRSSSSLKNSIWYDFCWYDLKSGVLLQSTLSTQTRIVWLITKSIPFIYDIIMAYVSSWYVRQKRVKSTELLSSCKSVVNSIQILLSALTKLSVECKNR